jgi:AraC-like DNA-binding protein
VPQCESVYTLSVPEPGISSAIVGPVLEVLAAAGLDLDARGASVDAGDEVVRGSSADRWLDLAAERLGDEALGLTLARRIPIGGLGLIDYALCTSATLRDALERVSRHYAVATQRVKLALVERGERLALVFERQPGISHSRHWMEFSFAILTERARQTLGREVSPVLVSFRHDPPACADAHSAFFGTEVRFSAPEDCLAFDRNMLDGHLRTAAASLAELLDARMPTTPPPPEDAGPDAFLERVRDVIAELIAQGDASLEGAATRLHTSTRTLQRELSRRRTSHKDLLDSVRRERAQALLGEGTTTVAEVAARLAYSEPSAFFRAFRRWTGTSPRARR